ncbi:unnamed protein product [marine sediment metagenome]|uniref:Uncharacterized protein n=1 Tax=marine sediment metagenome TaxID=412755 RepID=X0VQG8_9ZZZZ
MIEYKVYEEFGSGSFEQTTYREYNLTKCVVETNTEGYDEEDENIEVVSEKDFEENITTVKYLVGERIEKLNGKIKNNKVVISLSDDNQRELEKAKKHLDKNNKELRFMKKWQKNNK